MTTPLRVLLLLVSVALAIPAAAYADFTAVFSRTYVRSTGSPESVTDVFTACDPTGSFRLTVVNGPADQPRVTSASIALNGLEVVTQSEFNDQVAQIQKPLAGVGATNSLTVRLTAKPTGAILLTVDGDQNCLGITIVSPRTGDVVQSPLLVRGQARASGTGDVGVTVNGRPAVVTGDSWAAVALLEPGPRTITADLNDASGLLARATVDVEVAAAPVTLRVGAAPAAGIAPLAVALSAVADGPAALYQWDVDGNGTIDASGPALDTVSFTYTAPGLYLPTVVVTDPQGGTTTARGAVTVLAQADLVAMLESKWQALKDALRAGDVPRALGFIAAARRSQYDAVFRNLTVPLSAIDQVLTDLRFVQARGSTAEFEMLRTDARGELSYLVRFVVDEDGIWRLRDM